MKTARNSNITKNTAEKLNLSVVKEQGGLIIYNDNDQDEFVGKILPDIIPDYKEIVDEKNRVLARLKELDDKGELTWKQFGEPGRSVEEYGEPYDDYDGEVDYTLIDDEILVIRGEGDTFRVFSEEDLQEAEDNFWVMNSEIQGLKEKIKILVAEGTNMSLRARLFKDFSSLKSVFLSEGVIGIRMETFAGCPIKTILLPSTLEHLIQNAFVGAEFSWLSIPRLNSDSAYWEFQTKCIAGCPNLKYIFIPESTYNQSPSDFRFPGCTYLHNRWYMKDGRGVIKVDEKYGLMRTDGTWIVEPKFSAIGEFNEGLCPAAIGDGEAYENKWGYIDQEGNWAIAPEYSFAEKFSCGVGIVDNDDDLNMLIDKDGKQLGNMTFATVYPFHHGYAWAATAPGQQYDDGLLGIIDTKGNWVIKPNHCFDELEVETLEYWDYCKDWVAKVAEEYDTDENEEEEVKGLKAKRKGERWGYVDENDNWVIKPTLDSAEDFEEECSDCAIVKKGGKYGVIMKDGTFALKPQVEQAIRWYDFILVGEECEEKEIGVCGKCGILRSDGTWLFEYGDYIYDYIAQPHARAYFYLELWRDGDLCQLLFSDGTLKGDDYD